MDQRWLKAPVTNGVDSGITKRLGPAKDSDFVDRASRADDDLQNNRATDSGTAGGAWKEGGRAGDQVRAKGELGHVGRIAEDLLGGVVSVFSARPEHLARDRGIRGVGSRSGGGGIGVRGSGGAIRWRGRCGGLGRVWCEVCPTGKWTATGQQTQGKRNDQGSKEAEQQRHAATFGELVVVLRRVLSEEIGPKRGWVHKTTGGLLRSGSGGGGLWWDRRLGPVLDQDGRTRRRLWGRGRSRDGSGRRGRSGRCCGPVCERARGVHAVHGLRWRRGSSGSSGSGSRSGGLRCSD